MQLSYRSIKQTAAASGLRESVSMQRFVAWYAWANALSSCKSDSNA
jgi:hypothetical protein